MRRTILLVLGISFFALACGTAQQTGGGPATGQPKKGGALNLHIPTDPNDWDPTLSGKSLDNSQNGHNLASEELLTYKHGPGTAFNDATLVPELAQSWEMSPDAKAFTFHLRKGMRWPSVAPVNGRALTSDDVKFTYEYSSRTGQFKDAKLTPATYAAYFEGLDRVETPDADIVVVRFKDAFPPFPYYAGSGWNPIFAKEIFQQDGNFSNQIVGMGPRQLDLGSSQVGSKFVWKRNTNYHDASLPYIDQVNYLIIKDTSTVAAAFSTKQTDFLGGGMGPRDYQDIKAKSNAEGSENFASVADWRLYMNIRKPGLDNAQVRKALSMAIDRDKFLGTLGEGHFKVSLEGVQPGLFTDEEIKKFLPYDPNQSKQLLAQAGYPNGIDFEMTFPGNSYGESYLSGLQLFLARLKQVGINVTLKSEDKGDWNAKRRTAEYTLGLQQNNSVEGDMDSYLFAAWYSKSRSNYNGIKDPKVDQLAEAQRKEADPAKRRDLLRQLVTYVMENNYSVPIGNIAKYELWQPYLKGYAPAEYLKGTRFTDVWLDK